MNKRIIIGILIFLCILIAIYIPLGLYAHHQTACIHQLNTIEILAIQHGNMFGVQPGQPLPAEFLINEVYGSKEYKCPKSFSPYIYTGIVPTQKVGTKPYAQCSVPGHTFDPYRSTAK